MNNYKRLTERRGDLVIDNCRNCPNLRNPQGCTDATCYGIIKNRLAELEDKIEAGTLIEIPCKVGDNAVAIIDTLFCPNMICNVKLKDLAYIVEDENGDVTFQHITRIFRTKAEAEKRLEEIRNETKSIDNSEK